MKFKHLSLGTEFNVLSSRDTKFSLDIVVPSSSLKFSRKVANTISEIFNTLARMDTLVWGIHVAVESSGYSEEALLKFDYPIDASLTRQPSSIQKEIKQQVSSLADKKWQENEGPVSIRITVEPGLGLDQTQFVDLFEGGGPEPSDMAYLLIQDEPERIYKWQQKGQKLSSTTTRTNFQKIHVPLRKSGYKDGDRVFLYQHGKKSGLIGCGTILVDEVDPERSPRFRINELADAKSLLLEKVLVDLIPEINWRHLPKAGMVIPLGIEERLSRYWAKHYEAISSSRPQQDLD